jgi:hypothetical protein
MILHACRGDQLIPLNYNFFFTISPILDVYLLCNLDYANMY